MVDSFLRKEEDCTSTSADGLAGTDQKIFKTEEHHNLYSSSAEVDGKDNEVGSQESPECTKSHEKPSTSVVKVVKKGEMLTFWFCLDLFPKSMVEVGRMCKSTFRTWHSSHFSALF